MMAGFGRGFRPARQLTALLPCAPGERRVAYYYIIKTVQLSARTTSFGRPLERQTAQTFRRDRSWCMGRLACQLHRPLLCVPLLMVACVQRGAVVVQCATAN